MIKATRHGQVLRIQMSRYPDFRPPRVVSAYLINDLIIDTGPACTAAELAEFLRGTDIRLGVNTHQHEDHVGANKILQDDRGVEIYAHPLAVDRIAERPELSAPQEDVWGYPIPSGVKPLPDYVEASNLRFEVIYTPGHVKGHVCLFEQGNRWLFSGDAYITSRPVVCRIIEDQWQMIEDLKRMRDLQPAAMFTGPSAVIIDPAARLTSTADYLEDLGSEITRLYNKGMEIPQIRQTVFGDESPFAALTLGHFSSLNMVKSFLRQCGNADEA
jgi:glyoxylase-like metal-dependent hydrolase (beta-lactamase superfamily II)